MISHKRTFFDNISSAHDRALSHEARRLEKANTEENKSFDSELYRRKVMATLPSEKADRLLKHAFSPTKSGEHKKAVVISQTSNERRLLKKKMKSRRQCR